MIQGTVLNSSLCGINLQRPGGGRSRWTSAADDNEAFMDSEKLNERTVLNCRGRNPMLRFAPAVYFMTRNIY